MFCRSNVRTQRLCGREGRECRWWNRSVVLVARSTNLAGLRLNLEVDAGKVCPAFCALWFVWGPRPVFLCAAALCTQTQAGGDFGHTCLIGHQQARVVRHEVRSYPISTLSDARVQWYNHDETDEGGSRNPPTPHFPSDAGLC